MERKFQEYFQDIEAVLGQPRYKTLRSQLLKKQRDRERRATLESRQEEPLRQLRERWRALSIEAVDGLIQTAPSGEDQLIGPETPLSVSDLVGKKQERIHESDEGVTLGRLRDRLASEAMTGLVVEPLKSNRWLFQILNRGFRLRSKSPKTISDAIFWLTRSIQTLEDFLEKGQYAHLFPPAAGMEEGSRPRVRLVPALQQIPAPLRQWIKQFALPTFLGFGEMSQQEMEAVSSRVQLLYEEMVGSNAFSSREKKALYGFLKDAAQGNHMEGLRRLNLEVLVPRGFCLVISRNEVRLLRVAGYELYKIPGIKASLPVIYTPDLGRGKAYTSPSGVAEISTRNTPDFLRFACDEELRHLVDVYKFKHFYKVKSLEELNQKFRFRSKAKLPTYLGFLPGEYADLAQGIVEEARALLWHLYHPRPYQEREDIDVSLILEDAEWFQMASRLKETLEGAEWFQMASRPKEALEEEAKRIVVENLSAPSERGGGWSEHDLALFWVAARILSLKPEGPYELSEIRPLGRQIWEQEFSRLRDPIQHRARRVYPKTKAEREAQLIRLAQQTAGLEEKRGLGEILDRLRVELPPAGQQEQPLRFIVDTSRGVPGVLRLLQVAVLLEKEKGLRVQAAGVATAEQLAAALDQLPDETSRLLFESRVSKYVPGDDESYRKAVEEAQKRVPKLHPEAIITEINHLTIGWFLGTIEILGLWKLSGGLKRQIHSVLAAA